MANHLDKYFNSRTHQERIAALRSSEEKLPISLTEDLLELGLPQIEKVAILEATDSEDSVAFEHLLTRSLLGWDQDLATAAIRLWAKSSPRLLWWRLHSLCDLPHTAQRVRYTILDLAQFTGGNRVVEKLQRSVEQHAEDYSPAFMGLLFSQSIAFGTCSKKLDKVADEYLQRQFPQVLPDNKALVCAIGYQARFHPEKIQGFARSAKIPLPWRDQLSAVESCIDSTERDLKSLRQALEKKDADAALKLWPATWNRHRLKDKGTITSAMELILGNEESETPNEHFIGIPAKTLSAAILDIQDDAIFANSINQLAGWMENVFSKPIISRLRSANPSELSARVRFEIQKTSGNEDLEEWKTIAAERDKAEASAGPFPLTSFSPSKAEKGASLESRKKFFDQAYRNKPTKPEKKPKDYWQLLHKNWVSPDKAGIDDLATAARKINGPFQLCYISTLGRFEGQDEAVLKLMDFTRSKEANELQSVMQALKGIGTPRALQELVGALTRPNVTRQIQLEIAHLLQGTDTQLLQNEIRSAMTDLKLPTPGEVASEINLENEIWELRECLTSLLKATTDEPKTAKIAVTEIQPTSEKDLDHALTQKIPEYPRLSSEVKRALRTAQFFDINASSSNAPEAIDLSPVIDMQYKALELFFRESFEEYCTQLIQVGTLQRKLDLIGYARPIPAAMHEFEGYISSLPTIRDIPFFSKFKLRKMLRAICQYRPGKRFTLDGLKAFAIFFLCFGREECRYGLENIFRSGCKQPELFEFCKILHIMQDFRNRAAHEGFHPEASNDIEGIWASTAEIVRMAFFVQEGIDRESRDRFAPKNQSNPIITKKVS